MKGSHLGEFELTVMLVLAATGEPASGRRVYEEIVAQTGRDAAVAAVHVTLARLEEKGLVELSLAPEGNGGRAVRHFAVTPGVLRATKNLAYRKTFAARVTDGFGSTCGKIGILIALASIIGTCLLESGAADRIVRSTLKCFGERGAPASFLTSGFLLGAPSRPGASCPTRCARRPGCRRSVPGGAGPRH